MERPASASLPEEQSRKHTRVWEDDWQAPSAGQRALPEDEELAATRKRARASSVDITPVDSRQSEAPSIVAPTGDIAASRPKKKPRKNPLLDFATMVTGQGAIFPPLRTPLSEQQHPMQSSASTTSTEASASVEPPFMPASSNPPTDPTNDFLKVFFPQLAATTASPSDTLNTFLHLGALEKLEELEQLCHKILQYCQLAKGGSITSHELTMFSGLLAEVERKRRFLVEIGYFSGKQPTGTPPPPAPSATFPPAAAIVTTAAAPIDIPHASTTRTDEHISFTPSLAPPPPSLPPLPSLPPPPTPPPAPSASTTAPASPSTQARQCAQCGTTQTITWRKGSDGAILCNRCGLKYWRKTKHQMEVQRVTNALAMVAKDSKPAAEDTRSFYSNIELSEHSSCQATPPPPPQEKTELATSTTQPVPKQLPHGPNPVEGEMIDHLRRMMGGSSRSLRPPRMREPEGDDSKQ